MTSYIWLGDDGDRGNFQVAWGITLQVVPEVNFCKSCFDLVFHIVVDQLYHFFSHRALVWAAFYCRRKHLLRTGGATIHFATL